MQNRQKESKRFRRKGTKLTIRKEERRQKTNKKSTKSKKQKGQKESNKMKFRERK